MQPILTGTGAAMQKKDEVVVYIDTLYDIYSAFDPRKIDVRMLSADFIKEVRLQAMQAVRGTQMEINILAPKFIRKHELTRKSEKITRRRILGYFQDEYQDLRTERKKQMARALTFLISGLTCFFLVKLAGNVSDGLLFLKMLLELITFFSWFATWSGIDAFSDLPKRREMRLRRRLAGANIQFKFVRDITTINPM